MYTLACAALAALANVIWWRLYGTWLMPLWLSASILFGLVAAAGLLERLLERRRLLAGRARRAHARTTTPRRNP